VRIAWLCFMSFAAGSWADNLDLFELSLDDLSKARVTVSSSRPETRLETPAIVTRFSVDEMRAMGLTELTDILSFVPGVNVQRHLFGQPFLSVRGVYEGFNQKVLFLIDDTPYVMPSHSAIPLKGIPLDVVSHVEIIRGPGAVYYGTNATAGVIKVVTKQRAEQAVRITTSEQQDWQLSGVAQLNTSADTSLMMAAQLEADSRIDVTYPAFETFAAGDVKQVEKNQSIYAKYQYGKSRVFFHGFESQFTGLAQPRNVNNINILTYTGFMLSALHEKQLDTNHQLKIFADYNRFYLKFDVKDFVASGQDGGFRLEDDGKNNDRIRMGINWDGKLTNWLNGFAGIEWERRATGDYEVFEATTNTTTGTIMPSFHLNEHSIYAQADMQPYLQGRVLVGVRYSNNEIIGESVVPRLAWVHKANAHNSFKALYSVGFNTPSFTQLKADFNGLVNGNENLKAERIESFDFGWYWQRSDINAGVTLFHYTAYDFVYSDRSSGAIEFYNSDQFSHNGVELEWEQNYQHNLKVFANLNYLFDGNQVDSEDSSAEFSVKYAMNIGAKYIMQKHLIGASIRYLDSRASANALTLWNMSYQYTLTNIKLKFDIKNLLEDDYLQPNMAEFNQRLVPNGSSTHQISASLSYQF